MTIAIITLNRPEVRNALNPEMIQRVIREAKAADKDPSVRAIVLRGEGDFFCAGADLQWMKSSLHASKAQNKKDATLISNLMATLYNLKKPLIAVVQGAAIGGGVGLVAVADIVIASEDCVFGLSEVKLGIIPSIIAPYVIQKIGTSQSRRYFITGERLRAAQAAGLDLVHSVVPRDQLQAELDKILSILMTGGPKAIIAAKQMVKELIPKITPAMVSKTINAIANIRVTPEGQEGMSAFLEKRKPSWML
ncbi:MAG: hypothetical protein COV45_02840 [Deltaproteobacteria bacterium CG11_big_fil_rev_8_21_14_0_20_47_16]|nr:MAG: hypothetical protein COV45_02840 [Deltaproteobacteria bacterium CG11_big_fil_rev_8_21_14_0_20_47_16]